MRGGGDAHEHHLTQVKRDRAVLGLELVPAGGLARQLVGGVSASRSARCLAARRALITWPPPNPISTRFISSAIDPPRSLVRLAAGSTSSVSAPPVAFGCRNATRLPRIPIRASESISSMPASLQARQRRVDVVDPVGDVMKALAALGDEPADHGLGPEGRSSSTCPSPTSSSTASTPCDSTVSRCATGIPKAPS